VFEHFCQGCTEPISPEDGAVCLECKEGESDD
jgi:hypothetical protein